MALELDYLPATRGYPGRPQRVPRGLRTGTREPDKLRSRDRLGQPLGEERLRVGLVAAHEAQLGGPDDGLRDTRMAVAQEAGAEGHVEVDVLPAVHVTQASAPGALGQQGSSERRMDACRGR